MEDKHASNYSTPCGNTLQGREFSADYLERAGTPTVELIAQAVAGDNRADLDDLVEQLNREIYTMYYSYNSWERVIKKSVKARDGDDRWQQIYTQSLTFIDDSLSSKQTIFTYWDSTNKQIVDALALGNTSDVLEISRDWHHHALQIHDQMMTYITGLLTTVKQNYDDQYVQELLAQIMDPSGMQLTPSQSFRERVDTIVSFTRVHLQAFQLIEDDEKVTFIASPCPSGGRLVLQGSYSEEGGAEYVTGNTPLTYGRDSLPIYCCHEPAMELATILKFGAPVFVVEPSDDLGHKPCHVHIYKRMDELPDTYYQRLGLNRNSDLIAKSSA